MKNRFPLREYIKWDTLTSLFNKKLFLPNEYYQDIDKIDIEYLKKIGIKGIIFDIDQTLTYYHKTEMPQKIKQKFKKIKKEFKCCAISNYNNLSMKRIKREKEIEKKYLIKVIHSPRKKPDEMPFILCIGYLKTHIHDTAMIGNVHISDIVGGNRLGMHTIQVNSFLKHTPLHIIIYLFLEKIIRLFYKKKTNP